MLSNPLHRLSPYHGLPANNLLSNDHVPAGHLHANSLDNLGQGSHYSLQPLSEQVSGQDPNLSQAGQQQKGRQRSYSSSARASGAAGPVRRRISRACDQCNQLRTKCDGQHPCAHCVEFGLGCEYARERKKRGKASRKDLAQQAAAQTTVQTTAHGPGRKSPKSPRLDQEDDRSANREHNGPEGFGTMPSRAGGTASTVPEPRIRIGELGENSLRSGQPASAGLDELSGVSAQRAHIPNHAEPMDRGRLASPPTMDLSSYGGVPAYNRQAIGDHILGSVAAPNNASSYQDLPYGLQPSPSGGYLGTSTSFRLGNNSLSAYSISGEAPPNWMTMSSPPPQFQAHLHKSYATSQVRYPVLEPLIPHLGNIIPLSLACDLIDLYFASSSSAQVHPMSSYVLGYVFRRRSFLHPTHPRRCQPALLASMLWVAAQTSDAPLLTSVPSARGKFCQKLLELTVSLLRPLIHTTSGDVPSAPSPANDGAALGGLGVALPGSISLDALTGESGPFGAAGTLDDVATYIHLATVVSASEYKGASIRWWNAAWSLARELKLGRELPQNNLSMHHVSEPRADINANGTDGMSSSGSISDEEREERRRIWWLVYIVDRHLALCYNRPLFLLDIECEGLLQPMEESAWQNGDFAAYAGEPNPLASDPAVTQARHRGPSFECSGHSIFGYFLPLMTILGEIVDLHHARNHPRFGGAFRSSREWESQTAEITRHLEIYELSLKRFEKRHFSGGEDKLMDVPVGGDPTSSHDIGTPSVNSVHSAHTSSSRMTESDIQTRIVMAYGTHVMHVLHILLAGKWDPISLLDDNDLWISSQGFITATGHAVSAAEAISQILEFDPGLEFMPFFFGIYLLQGSFLMLLIADKLQVEASPSVVKACETIVRAHEACVVTLSTEYQRNFSKVMRSALAQVRGRVPEDIGEQNQRRRELLALYRWTGDGTGLAL